MKGRVLAIAGSDSGGGAGVQADVKTLTALGCYAATSITAITVQDTRTVYAIHPVPPDVLRLQIERALEDPGVDAVKTGMLGSAEAVAMVAEIFGRPENARPLVVDPVMAATSGAALLAPDALDVLKQRLIPLAAVLTPNVPEAELLINRRIRDRTTMIAGARRLLQLGAKAIVLKGGHLRGRVVTDLFATLDGVVAFESPRIETRHTHGTGCTLASAIAAGLAQGMGLAAALDRARRYVQAAIAGAPGIGAGNGPLNHAVTVDPALIERRPLFESAETEGKE
jgi:hydroxymethylpyrimidine/phosphomethylpyrimidine kinase